LQHQLEEYLETVVREFGRSSDRAGGMEVIDEDGDDDDDDANDDDDVSEGDDGSSSDGEDLYVTAT
jgi:hypothetical protein